MWTLVRANRMQTALLVAISLVTSVVIGYVLGRIAGVALGVGPRVEAGLVGVEVAIVVWVVITVVTWYQGDALILAAAGAEPIEFKDHPQFCNVVEEMALAANLGRTPKPYIIQEQAMNAFATGMRPEMTAIAVTAGALARLNRDQLQGLVAHETAKIAHGDVLFLSLVSLMTGAVFARGAGRGRDTFGRNPRYTRGGVPLPAGQGLARALCGGLAVFAPVYAIFIAVGVVRKRVYLADAAAALYTRYPEGLAGALHVISGDPYTLVHANRGIATLCTVNPYKKEMGIHTPFLLGATHPHTEQRISILRRIHGGVSLGAYQRAWQEEIGTKRQLVPADAMKKVRPVPIRESECDMATPPRERARAAGDLVRRLHDYLFLGCICGMRIKLPPTFPRDHVACPRCGRTCTVPTAALITGAAAAATVVEQATREIADMEGRDPAREAAARERALTAAPALTITRTTPGWMTFKCTCGTPNQISPSFDAPNTVCPECKAKIAIAAPKAPGAT